MRRFVSNTVEFRKVGQILINLFDLGDKYLDIIPLGIVVKSKLLCKFPFDRQHGPDDLTYGR